MMINSDKPIAFFDIETTGLNVKTDRIVEISIIIDNHGILKRPLTYRVNPEMPIPETATTVHGIVDADVAFCPTFKDIAQEILDIITSCHVAGFNSNAYDIPLLYNELLRAGYDWDYSECKFIDVGNLFKIMEPRTLEAAHRFYCNANYPDAHWAEADVYATIKVFHSMQDRYPDMTNNIEELAFFSNYSREMLDLSGRFSKNDKGEIVFNFGKHIGKPAISEKDYLYWMLNQDFAPDTKKIINKILEGKC